MSVTAVDRGGKIPDFGPSSAFVERFRLASEACASRAGLHTILACAAAELGFSHFALLHHASLYRSDPFLVRYDNYPREWARRFALEAAYRSDPVHRASQVTNAGFGWDEVSQLVRLSAAERDILRDSVRFGIGEGFTVPANIPGEPGASCSFAVNPGLPFPRHRLACAELVAIHAFKAARRLSGRRARRSRPHLSRRELDCLRFVAAGKTDWEIAAILGIGLESVRSYMKRARAAYDVVSRTQLVVHALRDAQIDFDESIPPDG